MAAQSPAGGAIYNFGDTAVLDGKESVLIAFWLRVNFWSSAYETFFSKDDYPAQSAGFGFQRNNAFDEMFVYSRGSGNTTNVLIHGPIQGQGWIHVGAYINTNPSFPRIQTYKNGARDDSTTSNVRNPFGNNAIDLQFVLTSANMAAQDLAIFTDLSLTDADLIMEALSLGFPPLAQHRRPLVWCELAGWWDYPNSPGDGSDAETDRMGTMLTAGNLANVTSPAAGPVTMRSHGRFMGDPGGNPPVLASASNSITLAATASEVANFAVSSADVMTFTPQGRLPRVDAAATTTLGLLPIATEVASLHIAIVTPLTITPTLSGYGAAGRAVAATTVVRLVPTPTATNTSILVSASSRVTLGQSSERSLVEPFRASATTKLRLSNRATPGLLTTYEASAFTSLGLTNAARDARSLALGVSAESRLGLAVASSLTPSVVVAAVTPIRLSADSNRSRAAVYSVSASSLATLRASARTVRPIVASAGSSFSMRSAARFASGAATSGLAALSIHSSASASRVSGVAASASTDLILAAPAIGRRDINASVVVSLGLADGGPSSNQFRPVAGSGSVSLAGEAESAIGYEEASVSFAIADRADAHTTLPSGGGVPGGDNASGLRLVLTRDISGDYPVSYVETPLGVLLIANGIDPMVRWDGLTATASPAGVPAPTDAPSLAGAEVGRITGRRAAFLRHIDADGNPSNLSPVSNLVDMGRDAAIEDVTLDADDGTITVRSTEHGLIPDDWIVIDGVEGDLAAINGEWKVTPVDADRFSIQGVRLTAGTFLPGGYWTWGVKRVIYTGVPIPSDPRVARRQLLRNLDGDMGTFYVDVDTDDLDSSAFVSEKSDEELSACEPVALTFEDGSPAANRFAEPPSHKAVLAFHQGRVFAASERAYSEGHAVVVPGSAAVRGVGTAWRASFAGRVAYFGGATKYHEILAVDEAAQVMTLASPYSGPPSKFAACVVRPAPAERRLVYFSEPGQPEAWPPWNAVAVPEHGDEITGLMTIDSFLYVVERRHIHRLTFQSDPARDGFIFPRTNRGAINARCIAVVEGSAYMLDEAGIHAFDGDSSRPVSTPIRPLFLRGGLSGMQVDWDADRTLWHAAHDPAQEMIRWFVTMVGREALRHAICFDYRLGRWWIEEYPSSITSSTVATIGHRRSLAGTRARRVVCLGEGTTDAAPADAAIRGTVSSATATTLVDSSAPFPENLAGAPVSIVDGTGVGQLREVAENTADTLTVVRPWDVTPDATSVYQIGGIRWEWKSGWFRFADDEASNPRDVEVVFRPLPSPASMDLELYYDHRDEPKTWSVNRKDDGVRTREGQSRIVIDMTTQGGYAMQRLSGHKETYAHGQRFVSARLSGVQGADRVQVFHVTINGVG
jgi:hypothetical protein